MSGWTQAGSCPRCGAPMWVPTIWHGIVPPTPTRTCECFPQPQTYHATGSGSLAPYCSICGGHHLPGQGRCNATYSMATWTPGQ